jgi:hypothetical protein
MKHQSAIKSLISLSNARSAWCCATPRGTRASLTTCSTAPTNLARFGIRQCPKLCPLPSENFRKKKTLNNFNNSILGANAAYPIPHIQHHVNNTIRYPNNHKNDPIEPIYLQSRHRPSLSQQQQDQHKRCTTENVKNITGHGQADVAHTVHRKLGQVEQDQTLADEFEQQTDRKQPGHRMLLDANRVNLHWHQY